MGSGIYSRQRNCLTLLLGTFAVVVVLGAAWLGLLRVVRWLSPAGFSGWSKAIQEPGDSLLVGDIRDGFFVAVIRDSSGRLVIWARPADLDSRSFAWDMDVMPRPSHGGHVSVVDDELATSRRRKALRKLGAVSVFALEPTFEGTVLVSVECSVESAAGAVTHGRFEMHVELSAR